MKTTTDGEPIVVTRRIPTPWVLLLTVATSSLAGLYVWWFYTWSGQWADIDQIWIGARALLAGEDPYAVVAANFPWPLYYPLPALIFGLPLAPLPLPWARVVFAAVAIGTCTWAVARYRPHALPLLFTGPFLYAAERGQWAPLLVAAAIVPGLGVLLAAKPSGGLAIFLFSPRRSTIIGGVAVVVLSLVIEPGWPSRWLATFHGARHLLPPVTLLGGWTLLFALRNWRNPEARLLAALALVPQTPGLYEVCLLTLVPQTRRRALILAISVNMLYLLTIGIHPLPPMAQADVPFPYTPGRWPYTYLFAFLPALVMVLWPPRFDSVPQREAPQPDDLSLSTIKPAG